MVDKVLADRSRKGLLEVKSRGAKEGPYQEWPPDSGNPC